MRAGRGIRFLREPGSRPLDSRDASGPAGPRPGSAAHGQHVPAANQTFTDPFLARIKALSPDQSTPLWRQFALSSSITCGMN